MQPTRKHLAYVRLRYPYTNHEPELKEIMSGGDFDTLPQLMQTFEADHGKIDKDCAENCLA